MLLQILRRDGGPIYAETNLSHLIVEPYNAISAILFMVVVVYWWSKLRGKYEQHTFLSYVIPILGIGGVGGTLYHAFRYTSIFHYMDWLPILFLCMAGSFYFCYKFFEGIGWAIGISVVGVILQALVIFNLPAHTAENISYSLLAIQMLVPTWLVMQQQNFVNSRYVWIALTFFCLALTCRAIDFWGWLPMGTHFLWHVFGAAASHFMIQYVYLLNELPRSPARDLRDSLTKKRTAHD